MRVVVFAGSASGNSPRLVSTAAGFGRRLAEAGVGIVYGGGRVGLMGVLADAALAAGGEVIGVIPRSLVDAEIAHPGLTLLRIVETMRERKETMAELGDAFVALPGGAGTLEELFEAWTSQQLGLHQKPVAVLEADGFWGPLLGAMDHIAASGFLRPVDRAALLVVPGAAEFLAAVRAWEPPQRKWDAHGFGHDGAPLVSVGWIHTRDGRLLTVRTRDRDMLYLPGGKPEPGETGPQALGRELSEELGLTLHASEMAETFTIEAEADAQDGRRLRMTCYTGTASGEPQAGREIEEVAWINRFDVERCAPALRQVIDRLTQTGQIE